MLKAEGLILNGFIGAELLKVQIRKNKFAQLMAKNDQNLIKDYFLFET